MSRGKVLTQSVISDNVVRWAIWTYEGPDGSIEAWFNGQKPDVQLEFIEALRELRETENWRKTELYCDLGEHYDCCGTYGEVRFLTDGPPFRWASGNTEVHHRLLGLLHDWQHKFEMLAADTKPIIGDAASNTEPRDPEFYERNCGLCDDRQTNLKNGRARLNDWSEWIRRLRNVKGPR